MTAERVRCILTAVVLSLGMAARAAPQAPRVRVEFHLADIVYVQSFDTSERRQIEDSATAMFMRAFARHLRFLSFTRDQADSTRVLSVILDQKDRSATTRLGERGLHLGLKNGGPETAHLYWRTFRSLGFAARDTVGSVTTFLGELGVLLEGLDDSAWEGLVTNLLSQISIADTNAAAWAPPPGSGALVEWLIPLRSDAACFDTDRSKLLITNRVPVPLGSEVRSVTAKPSRTLTEDTTVVVPRKLERFRGQIRATLDPPATGFPAPPDSIHVTAVKVTAYKFDDIGCAMLAGPQGGGGGR